MACFWSKTDTDTIEELGNNGWILASVFNQKREMKSAFYSKDGMTTPLGQSPLYLDDLTTEIAPCVEAEAWEKEYVANVQKDFPNAWATPLLVTDGSGNTASGTTKRPAGISKREWKKLRKRERLLPPPAEEIDGYGFDQFERTILAEAGYDISAIDELVDRDFTPAQLLKLAEYGIDLPEVLFLMDEQNMEVEDVMQAAIEIDRVPVDLQMRRFE